MGAIQLLEFTGPTMKINTSGMNQLLEKVADLPIVLISMNGSSREGKSYALNYFIRYFKFNSNSNSSDDQWFKSDLPPEELFSFKSGRERETVGLNLYSEPFIFTTATGNRLAILLLDCQGLFDDRTNFKQNAVIFALSNLFSSVLIYNVKCKIEENLLQNIQFFSNYAQAIIKEQQQACQERQGQVKNLDNHQEMSDTDEPADLLPALTFLIRDFAFDDEYPFGLHSSSECPKEGEDPQNYFQASFSINQSMPLENQIIRKDILSKFEDVNTFLVPFPGRPFLVDSINNPPDEDFQEYLKLFVQTMTQDNFLKVKTSNGEVLTGRQFQQELAEWVQLFEESVSKFPEVQTLAQAQSLIRNEIAFSSSLTIFEERFEHLFKSARHIEMTEDDLASHCKSFFKDAQASFTNSRCQENPETLDEFLGKMEDECQQLYENYLERHRNSKATFERQVQQQKIESSNQQKIQELSEEMLRLKTNEVQAITAENSRPLKSNVGAPIKPKRKAPPTPKTENPTAEENYSEIPAPVEAPRYENIGLIEDLRQGSPSVENEAKVISVSHTTTPADPNLKEIPEDNQNSNTTTLKKPKSAFSRFKNFFTGLFRKGSQNLNRNLSSKFRKRNTLQLGN